MVALLQNIHNFLIKTPTEKFDRRSKTLSPVKIFSSFNSWAQPENFFFFFKRNLKNESLWVSTILLFYH